MRVVFVRKGRANGWMICSPPRRNTQRIKLTVNCKKTLCKKYFIISIGDIEKNVILPRLFFDSLILETMEEAISNNPIEEARRYVANAEEIIQKSKYDPETESYRDKKYVRIAGDTLWKGCLIALDAVFNVRKGKGRPSIKKYQEAVAKRDGKLLKFLNLGYETMHLVMGYDGNRDKKICDAGFERANAIIDNCAMLMPKVVCA